MPDLRRLTLAALMATAATSSQAATLKDENLLAPIPQDYVAGDTGRTGPIQTTEFVPKGETVAAWSSMVTMQIVHGARNVNPVAYATDMAKRWQTACPGGEGNQSVAARENGYPVAIWLYSCPLNPTTGKPEQMYMKVIGGRDSLYLVQYAFRKPLAVELSLTAMRYMGNVSVCDTRRRESPCPAGM